MPPQDVLLPGVQTVVQAIELLTNRRNRELIHDCLPKLVAHTVVEEAAPEPPPRNRV